MKIILTECDTGNFMTFPMLPEEISVECATRFQSYDIMNVGEIMQPMGEELTRISWSCKIPGEKRQVKKEDNCYQNPYIIWTIVNKVDTKKENKKEKVKF